MQLFTPAETSKKPTSFDFTSASVFGRPDLGRPDVDVRIMRTSPTRPWTYRDLDIAQRDLADQVREGGAAGAILLNELEPVITTGKRTGPTDLIWTGEQFRTRGVEVLPVDRGGQATWHGPGQWVLFPVFALADFTGDTKGVRRAVDRLLHAAKATAAVYGVEAQIREAPATGLWTPRGKLASVGIRIDRGVILHGLSFNVFKTPLSFQGLRPCGADAQVDFLLPAPDAASFEQVGATLVRELGSAGLRELDA